MWAWQRGAEGSTLSERDHWLALALVPGVGPKMMSRLLKHFGSAAAVFEASLEELTAVSRVGQELARRILDTPVERVCFELTTLADEGIAVLIPTDEGYPAPLHRLLDAPPVLFMRGEWRLEDEQAVAIVGSRRASPQGMAMAERLAGELVILGFTIVSGLARGIDTAAHRGALAAGGRSVGVLGSGIRLIYPRENTALAEEMARQGAVLSEWPPNAPAQPATLMARDRLIGGLSLGVIVVEAMERSGSLDTAHKARRQGKALFAWKGGGVGALSLIAEGAMPLDERPAPEAIARTLSQWHADSPTPQPRQMDLF